MNCIDIRPQVDALIDGELKPLDKGRIEEHLKYCAACRQRVETARRTKDAMRNRVVKPATPGRLETRILRALRKGETKS